MEAPTFYVVTWHYLDHSCFGIVGIRDNADAAERLVAFLKLHCASKEYLIHETEMEAI